MAIVKMRRVLLLALTQEKEALLAQMQRMGCMEFRPAEEWTEVPAAFAAEASRAQEVRMMQQTVQEAVEHLRGVGIRAPLLERREKISVQDLCSAEQRQQGLLLAGEINAHGRALETLARQKKALAEQEASLRFWVHCPLPLGLGGTEQTALYWGTLPGKVEFAGFCAALEEAAPESAAYLMDSSRTRKDLVVLCHRSVEEATQKVLHAYGFRTAAFPATMATAREELAAAEEKQGQLDEQLRQHRQALLCRSTERKTLERTLDQVAQCLALEEAKERGRSDGMVTVLQGWVPAEQEDTIRAHLAQFTCAVAFLEPNEADTPPTLLKNPAWMEPINVVTEMYSLPDYRGIDPNPLIFGFYIFFFGFMFADVGYGLLLMAGAWGVLRRWNPKGTVGQLLHLGVYLGASTALCGLFTGGFFGNAVEVVAQEFFGRSMAELPLWVQRFQAGLVFHPLTSPMAVLYTTLGIGAVQLIFGQMVHIYLCARDGALWSGLLDTVPWWVLFGGVGAWLLGAGAWLFWLGVGLLVLTQGRSKPTVAGKLLGGVASLYGVTNWLSDLLSYSRLMALMLATSVIATVINTLGALPGSIVAFVPIFLVGHLFNIGVNLIGTYVHAARLQYLEFYGKFYREGGIPFRPLAFQTKFTDVTEEEIQ